MPMPYSPIDRVNYIVDFVEDPCQAPWTVYVRCAVPPLGRVALILLDIDIWDIFRAYFRPAGLRSWSHARLIRKGKRFLPDIPDINEMIGRHLPGAKILRGRMFSQLQRYLWIIDGVVQRALWWWLVIDLVTGYLYSWGSLVNESWYCRLGDKSGVLAEGDGGGFPAISGPVAVSIPDVTKQRGVIDWSYSTLLCQAVPAAMHAGITIENTGAVPHHFDLWLCEGASVDTAIAHERSAEIPPGGQAQVVITQGITQAGTYSLLGAPTAGFAEGRGAMAWCQEN